MKKKNDIALWTICITTAAVIVKSTIFRTIPAIAPEPDLCDVAQPTYTAEPQPDELLISQAAEITLPEQTTRSIEDVLAEMGAERMSYDWSGYDAYLLTKIAFYEAGGEDIEGQALVILVVLNRVESDEFPATIEEIIYQDGQFQPVWTGIFDSDEPPTKNCWDALEMVEQGWDESQGATYFCTPEESEWHEANLTRLFQHGGHIFYK